MRQILILAGVCLVLGGVAGRLSSLLATVVLGLGINFLTHVIIHLDTSRAADLFKAFSGSAESLSRRLQVLFAGFMDMVKWSGWIHVVVSILLAAVTVLGILIGDSSGPDRFRLNTVDGSPTTLLAGHTSTLEVGSTSSTPTTTSTTEVQLPAGGSEDGNTDTTTERGSGGGGPTSPTGDPSPDINGDGVVDVDDLSFVLADFNTSIARSDLNQDGVVNAQDLAIVNEAMGETSQPRTTSTLEGPAKLEPPNLKQAGYFAGEDFVALAWDPPGYQAAYSIFRNGVLVGTAHFAHNSYRDLNPPPGEHTYQIRADGPEGGTTANSELSQALIVTVPEPETTTSVTDTTSPPTTAETTTTDPDGSSDSTTETTTTPPSSTSTIEP